MSVGLRVTQTVGTSCETVGSAMGWRGEGGEGSATNHLDALDGGGDRLGGDGSNTGEKEVFDEAEGSPRLHSLIASGETRHGCGSVAACGVGVESGGGRWGV
jgi:hypothetical protein